MKTRSAASRRHPVSPPPWRTVIAATAAAFLHAAHGVSVMQLHRDADGWARDITSHTNRRITSRTPMEIAGPARGHALLRTNADPTGTKVVGTFANCSAGKTPWGTY